jgi:hypothetical protein
VTKKSRSEWDGLAARSTTLRRALRDLVDQAVRLGAMDDRDASRGATVLAPEMERWLELAGQLLPGARDLLSTLEHERADQLANLDQRIQRELARRGRKVHGEGSLLVVEGFVHVEIDAKKGSVRVDGHPCGAATAVAVADMVDGELERLRRRVTPPEKMAEQLHAAYTRELVVRGREPRSQIETAALLVQLTFLRQDEGFRSNPSSTNFREYPRELFRADLHLLLSAGPPEVHGVRFRCASGSNTAGAIFMHVPALGRCTHVGRMWFEAAGG